MFRTRTDIDAIKASVEAIYSGASPGLTTGLMLNTMVRFTPGGLFPGGMRGQSLRAVKGRASQWRKVYHPAGSLASRVEVSLRMDANVEAPDRTRQEINRIFSNPKYR